MMSEKVERRGAESKAAEVKAAEPDKRAAPDPLFPYDERLVPGAFKLRAGHNLCYMNSLMQCFVALSSVNGTLLKLVDKKQELERDLLIREICRLLSVKPMVTGEIPVLDTVSVFHALAAWRRRENNKLGIPSQGLIFGRQEDIHEDLTFLLDALGGMVSRHFEIRYSSEIICVCGSHREVRGPAPSFAEPPELMMDLTRTSVRSQEEVQEYITRHEQYPDGYRCEACGAKNTDRESKVKQVYTLRRLNEVIVLFFKKYHAKTKQYFPPALDFPAKQGRLHYEAIAQIDHGGSMNGGHYICRALRPKPLGFQEERDRSLQGKLLEARDPDTTTRICRRLDSWRSNANKRNDIFLFNDSEIKYAGEITPNADTYMVFYHLQHIRPITNLLEIRRLPTTTV